MSFLAFGIIVRIAVRPVLVRLKAVNQYPEDLEMHTIISPRLVALVLPAGSTANTSLAQSTSRLRLPGRPALDWRCQRWPS